MSLSKEEQEFISSINFKIKKYDIQTSLKECLEIMSGTQVYTEYNDNTVEIVDAGIEVFLIKKSFSYFINLYGRVDIPGIGTIPMYPYYFQSEMAKEINLYRKVVLDKTRQCGMSTVFALYAFWKAHFFPSESIDVVSLKQLKAQAFVKKIFTTMESLPIWMKTPIKSQNQQQIIFQHVGGALSHILSESQSENAGRSDSLSVLIMDEVAFYQSERMVRSIVASAQPTLNKTGGQMIIISTPNGTSGKGAYYYEQVIGARQGEKDTKYLEVDWWEIPDDIRIKGPKKGYNKVLDQAIKQDYYYNPNVKEKFKKMFEPISKELFRDNEWLSASYKDLGATTYRQEILHDFVISGDKVFNEDILKAVEERIKEPIIRDKFDSEQIEGLWIWKKPIAGHRYILGNDIGTGTGSDYSTIEIIDVGEYEQVAEYKGFISTPNLVRVLRKIAKWYNEGYIVIEANSIGEAVFNGIYYDEYEPYNNVYKQKKTKNGITRFTGWTTDMKSRKLIVNDFIDWITVPELWDTLKIYSMRIWLEMSTWIWTGGNKAEHAQGCVSGNTIITCEDGFKQIKDVVVGDMVLTHTGEFKSVYKTFKFKDETKKMLNVKSWGNEVLNITSNQEFYINNGEFKNFDDIYNFKGVKLNTIFSKKIEEYNCNKDELFLFFIGHILSDGTIAKKNNITITSENKESVIIFEKYMEYFKDKVENCYISEYPKEQFRRFTIKDKKLYNELKSIGVSIDKSIPKSLRYIEPKLQLNILMGYLFGDGSFAKERTGSITANSISFNLSYFISSILYRNDISFNINKTKVHRYERINSDQWSISILGKECLKIFENDYFNDIFYLKNNYVETSKFIKNKDGIKTSKLRNYNNDLLQSNIHSVERIDWNDDYYDLSITDNHSYVANGYVVHNSHDDSIMAFAIAIYNRNKAMISGDSFIIADDGTIIDYDKADMKDAEHDRITRDNDFGIVKSEDPREEDFYQEKYGVGKEDYEWLLQ